MKDILYYFQEKLDKKKVLRREKYFRLLQNDIFSKPIKVAVGARRVGKTSFLIDVIQYALSQGMLSLDDVCYCNCEDNVFNDYLSVEGLQAYREAFVTYSKKGDRVILFLDEIQNIDGWESFVRARYDEDNVFIFLTGSNSKLLSREIATSLSGRMVSLTIYPLDFREYLLFGQKYHQDFPLFRGTISESDFFLKNRMLLLSLFMRYLKYGGFPEVSLLANEEMKISYLQSVHDKVLLDDIIARYKVRQVVSLEHISAYLFSLMTKQLSYKKLQEVMNKRGYSVSYEKILDYVGYFEETFLITSVHKFDPRLQRVFSGSKKLYCLDNGLISALHQNMIDFETMYLENIVYITLAQQYTNVYFYTDAQQKEVDFLVATREEFIGVQVCFALQEVNKGRELGNLVRLFQQRGVTQLWLFVLEGKTEIISYHGVNIQVYNIVEYLLTQSANVPTKS